MIPKSMRSTLSRIKREAKGLRLTQFNQAKFDAAVAWMRRSKVGVVFLNIASLEVLATVSILKKIKNFFGKGSNTASFSSKQSNKQQRLSVLPSQQDNPRVLLIVEASIPQCLHYRVKQKVEQLEANGFYAQWHDWSDVAMLEQEIYHFDMVIFYRVPGYPVILDLMQHAKALRKLVLYDIDDLIFDREQLEFAFGQKTEHLNNKDIAGILNGASLFKAAIESAHYGIASTPVLQKELAKLVELKHCFLLTNGLDSTIESLAEKVKVDAGDDKVRIFYGSGTKTHDEDFSLIAEPLSQVLDENPNVELVLAGQLSLPEKLKKYAHRVQRLPSMSFQSYLRCLQHSDIAIAPLKSGVFADCKSEIKWLEAACLGVPSVVSSTERYEQVVISGENGFIAKIPEQWFEALSSLVRNQSLRDSVAKAAKASAVKKYASTVMAENMRVLLSDVQAQAALDHIMNPNRKAKKRRILVVNVLYPPNAIGGATTIAAQSIEGLLKHYGDDFELEVVTTEMSDKSPYSLREYEHLGVKVTVISVPSHVQLESRAYDEKIYSFFKQWLPQNRAELVHFHSMQRLTASPLQAASELDIPYVVTVHDAWWISDHQFLLDDKDQLVAMQQANPLIAAKTCSSDSQMGAGLERVSYLSEQLRAAKHIFAVSEFQARLYRHNGFEQVVTLKNGVSFQPQKESKKQNSLPLSESEDKLVVGYLGGVSAHKGYEFLKAIVEENAYDNLQFNIVDLFKPIDFNERSQWGTSSVNIMGKQAGEAINNFYADIDVLIAPSIWPESFGLVTREAALRGVWVLTADAGGLAEDVSEGETGFIFPMADANACSEKLSMLNRAWKHYKTTSPNKALSQQEIFTQQQHIDLLAEYYK